MVSVIIPTYNRQTILHRAVESVVNQTFTDWELLIVDDGSTDDTQQVIRDNYLHDSRIQFLERPESRPKGANACRNVGIEQANGQYIAFLDSDDEWKSKHLENCYRYATSTSNFTGSYTSAFVQRGPFLIKQISRSVSTGESYLDFLIGDGSAMTPTYFLKAGSAKQIMFDETLQRHQDWDFFIRFGNAYSWLFNPSEQVIVHRSITESRKNVDLDSCIRFYNTYEQEISETSLKILYLNRMYRKSKIVKDTEVTIFYKEKLTELRSPPKETVLNELLFNIRKSSVFLFLKYFAKKHFNFQVSQK